MRPVTDTHFDDLRRQFRRLQTFLDARVRGHGDVKRAVLTCLFSGGHALLEGAPGLAKTTLAKALTQGLGLSLARIQCTPDLMPSDVVGTRVLRRSPAGDHTFELEKGPIFAHVVLADEVNRATPKTQSAFLEAMEEKQVSIGRQTLPLPACFFVIATQNPLEYEGTYPLPEAQLDRFMMKVSVPAPDAALFAEILALTVGPGGGPTDAPPPCPVSEAALTGFQSTIRRGLLNDPELVRKISRFCEALQPKHEPSLLLGPSPRAAQAMLWTANVRALTGEAPAEIARVGHLDARSIAPLLRHRLVQTPDAAYRDDRDAALERVIEKAWKRA